MQWLHEQPALFVAVVFFARVLDVSLGTLRTILVFRAYWFLAAAIGFVEVLIWITAAGQVLTNLDRWYLAVAWAGGFATGNAVGIWLESKLAMGSELVRAISANPAVALASRLREQSYSVVELAGRGDAGQPVEVLLLVEKRRRLPGVLDLIDRTDPDAVYTISDVKRHRAGRRLVPPSKRNAMRLLRWFKRK